MREDHSAGADRNNLPSHLPAKGRLAPPNPKNGYSKMPGFAVADFHNSMLLIIIVQKPYI
jgi:hypothetical protein